MAQLLTPTGVGEYPVFMKGSAAPSTGSLFQPLCEGGVSGAWLVTH